MAVSETLKILRASPSVCSCDRMMTLCGHPVYDLVEDRLHGGASLPPSASSQILSDPVTFIVRAVINCSLFCIQVPKHQKSSPLARTQIAPRGCPRWGSLPWLSHLPWTVPLWSLMASCLAPFQRQDSVMMRKLQAPEEVGMPVSRNGSVPGLKLQNGYAPAKTPAGSPSPRLTPTPTHLPTVLDEPGKKVKKSALPQSITSSPTTPQGSPGTGESRSQRPGSWASRDTIFSTSPKLLAKAITNGHRQKGDGNGVDLEKGGSSSSSPEHCASSDPATAPQTSEGRATHVCDSQGTNCPATGHPKALLNGVDAKMVKLKPPALSSTTAEPTSLMSPPPAKKLALSAKKVGLWGSPLGKCPGAGDVRAG